MSFAQQKELEDAYVMPTFGRKPVQFVSGSGMTLVDDKGNTYLDFLSGIGVVSLGHCHPAVVDAIGSQASKLIHVSNYYYIEQRGDVARMLSQMLEHDVAPDRQVAWKSFFANSGAEANECAIKLARLHARKRAEDEGRVADEAPYLIVTLENSFHGRTMATLAATAQAAKQAAFQPLPAGFVSTPLNDVEALEQLFDRRGREICAVMVECIQGESGVHPCTPEFLRALRRLSAQCGALLICDEVQCGVYRTGKPFGFQQFGIVPDVVTIAKGIASGVPAAACAARGEIGDTFSPGDHGSTFGGSNIAMAAASATLRILHQDGFAARVEEVGGYLRRRLEGISQLCDVRGYGLMCAADIADQDTNANDVVLAGLDAGLVLNATGPHTLRFLPPLICQKEHVDELVDKLAGLL